MELDGAVADFAMDGGANNDPRGLRLPENARDKLAGPRNCWQDAYRKLFASCGEIMADKERQSRLAWHLTGCFQEDSGRPPFPPCAEGSKMVHCRKRLSESEGKVFLEFFLETNTLCHQLHTTFFAALDKLYILHNAILAESRFIKAFFFYCCIVFLVYMLTSAKQTFGIRGQLYFGLCITLLLEIGLIKIGADDFDRQFRVMSKLFLLRMVFLGVAIVQILHSIFTYSGTGRIRQCTSTRRRRNEIVAAEEIVGENSITTSVSRKYNLRPRK
uniref:Uncharacterized protein n=1 Tax=Sorghum bicolor TaxID=4558 RepID=Q8W0T2_SORBI|nr:hypothetical protein S250_18C08.13 [Sorghum bicolor]